MIYHGVCKRKIEAIGKVTALGKAKHEVKVAKTIGLITVALILTFVPVIVIGAWPNLFQVLRRSKAFHLTETLVQLNSLANPLIYFYRDRRYRQAALQLLRVRKRAAIQPAVGAALFIRAKNLLVSLKAVQERQQARELVPFKRAASCDLALSSYCHDRGRQLIFFKRSLSAPNLDTNDTEFFDASQS